MELFAGTSGYSYKAWKGCFYPEDLPDKRMLGYYAERLPAVEINNTFYRLPRESVLESWAAQVPDAFRFSIKASRRITHFKRLKDAGDETEYLLRVTQTLGDRLGVLLFQLPSNLKADLERLDAFLRLLPDGTRAVFEFRHISWQEDRVLARLRERGFAWCVSDTDEAPIDELVGTATWGYLRLRRSGYSEGELLDWAVRLRAQPWERAFVFFKHEDAGMGPRLAARFLEVFREAPERRRVARVRRAQALEADEQEAG